MPDEAILHGYNYAADDIGGQKHQRVKISIGADGSAEDLAPDGITRALLTLDYAHHEIHSGSAYTCNAWQMVSDINDRTAIGLLTPAGTKLVHMFVMASASAAATFIIREACTVADNQGATLAVLNRRRDNVTASIVLDTSQNPDLAGSATYFAKADQAHVTEDGTVLFQQGMAAGSGPFGVGGASRSEAEFILAASTQYVFYVKSINNDDNYHGVVLSWYENDEA